MFFIGGDCTDIGMGHADLSNSGVASPADEHRCSVQLHSLNGASGIRAIRSMVARVAQDASFATLNLHVEEPASLMRAVNDERFGRGIVTALSQVLRVANCWSGCLGTTCLILRNSLCVKEDISTKR